MRHADDKLIQSPYYVCVPLFPGELGFKTTLFLTRLVLSKRATL